MNKKIIILIICVSFIISMVAGCSRPQETAVNEQFTQEQVLEKETVSSQNTGESWSVFIYMCGTDLESNDGSATDNLIELAKVSFNDNVKVFVQTGATKKWQNEIVKNDRMQRFYVNNGNLELIEEGELTSMGDTNTLYEFLNWGVSNYPANKMGVIFWNHGGGSMSGSEYDELFDNDNLTLPEMGQAFEAALSPTGSKFEMIGFDTCLMANLENASMLSPYGNYLVASEEIAPGSGWDYTAWAQFLADNPESTGAELGTAICDSYFEKCNAEETSDIVTLSVTDLSKIDDLKEAFNSVALDYSQGMNETQYFSGIVRGASKTEDYGGSAIGEGFSNQLDLGHLVTNTADLLPESADALLSALSDAVVYKIQGDTRQYASGLSIFFPLNINEEDMQNASTDYNEIAPGDAYRSFVEKSVGFQSEAASMEKPLINITEPAYIDEEGVYQMTIDPASLDYVDTVTFSLYFEQDGTFLYLGNDNDLEMNWESGHVNDNFRKVWPTVNGEYVMFEIVEETDTYIVYSIPIMLNGEKINLRVTWTWDDPLDDTNYNGQYKIIGAWAGIDSDTGMAAREITQLKDGDSIIPLFYSTDENDNEVIIEGTEIVVQGTLELKESELGMGNYWYMFEIKDIYGNVTYSDFAVITVDEQGEMTISQ